MKKIAFLLLLVLTSISCTKEPDGPRVHLELMPISNVSIPDTIYAFENNNINIQYNRPSTCYGFDGFYYEKLDLTRTIAVQNYVIEDQPCTTLTNETREETLVFHPTQIGDYTFKFWQGKDANGNDIFLQLVRPVVMQ
jgi:hypothetical protein